MRPDTLILVVDDEEDLLELVCEILRSAGFASVAARHGEEALRLLERHSEIRLVITDVMMPHYDGPTLARRISRDHPGLPVLFMTGYPAETLEALGMLPEGEPPIQKPFAIKELIRKVKGMLKRA